MTNSSSNDAPPSVAASASLASPASPAPARTFEVHATTSPVFGRVLCSARNHHFVVDGPVYNNCPGEELTPPEIFLAAVASCGVELIQVLARESATAVGEVAIRIIGTVDRGAQPRPGVTVFNLVQLHVTLSGVTQVEGETLVKGFQGRCPIYGTVASGALKVETEVVVR